MLLFPSIATVIDHAVRVCHPRPKAGLLVPHMGWWGHCMGEKQILLRWLLANSPLLPKSKLSLMIFIESETTLFIDRSCFFMALLHLVKTGHCCHLLVTGAH